MFLRERIHLPGMPMTKDMMLEDVEHLRAVRVPASRNSPVSVMLKICEDQMRVQSCTHVSEAASQ